METVSGSRITKCHFRSAIGAFVHLAHLAENNQGTVVDYDTLTEVLSIDVDVPQEAQPVLFDAAYFGW
jgi:hypothetical protein